ncbi:rab9 effector protein with kelch motifs-like [Bolinopsis microptera]|uniref:rab9 effector protein with kelch motifs-like n=1 Tax=Bolinopsis microptera TaxID=2820187 RepID=UPI00307B00BA
MELFPILERRNKLNDNLWYVLSPTNNMQVQGGVGSKLCSRDTDIYITCGAQPDRSFGSVYHLSLDTFGLAKLQGEFGGRYEHVAVVHDNEVLVFGGADTSGNRNDLQKLNLVDGSVTDVPAVDAPSPRTIHNMGVSEGRVLVWGGGDTGATPVQDSAIHSLNLGSREWSKYESTGEVPGPRHGHVICCVKDRLYLHGGMEGENILGDLYSSDISKLKSQCVWMKHASSDRQPVARAAHSSTVHEKLFFIFGGFTGQHALDDLWRYDTDNGLWSEIIVQEPRPPPRLDLTICTARLPFDENQENKQESEDARAQEPPPFQDITSMLHQAAEETAPLPDSSPELPVSGYQDVLVLFGGMDLLGNIFNDIYAFKL